MDPHGQHTHKMHGLDEERGGKIVPSGLGHRDGAHQLGTASTAKDVGLGGGHFSWRVLNLQLLFDTEQLLQHSS